MSHNTETEQPQVLEPAINSEIKTQQSGVYAPNQATNEPQVEAKPSGENNRSQHSEPVEDESVEQADHFMRHSEQSVFGLDNCLQTLELLMQSSFHARLLHQINPSMIHFPSLDRYFNAHIKQNLSQVQQLQDLDQSIQQLAAQLDKVRAQRAKSITAGAPLVESEEDAALLNQIKELVLNQDHQAKEALDLGQIVKESCLDSQQELFSLESLPKREGGISYAQHTGLINDMNSVLITMLQYTQQDNLNIFRQILQDQNRSGRDPQREQEEQERDKRSLNEALARQRQQWRDQLGQVDTELAFPGAAPAFTRASEVEAVVKQIKQAKSGSNLDSAASDVTQKPYASQSLLGSHSKSAQHFQQAGDALANVPRFQVGLAAQQSKQVAFQEGLHPLAVRGLHSGPNLYMGANSLTDSSDREAHYRRNAQNENAAAKAVLEKAHADIAQRSGSRQLAGQSQALYASNQSQKQPGDYDWIAAHGAAIYKKDTLDHDTERIVQSSRIAQVTSDLDWRQANQHGSHHNESGDLQDRESSALSNGPLSGWPDYMQPQSKNKDTATARTNVTSARAEKPKKRVRRTANEINRRFICVCGKAYGSEGSLNQHKKNKGHFLKGEQGLEARPKNLDSPGLAEAPTGLADSQLSKPQQPTLSTE